MNNQKLYSFTVNKTEEVEEIQDGVSKKVTKSTPVQFYLKRPTRSFRDDLELFRGEKYAEGIKHGLIPSALLAKRVIDDQGVLSDMERERIDTLRKQMAEQQIVVSKIAGISENERSEEQKTTLVEANRTIDKARNELAAYFATQDAVYNNTVEVYARNKAILFSMLFLSFGADDKPVFGEVKGKDAKANYKEKLAKYDDFDNLNDPFWNTVINKFLTITTVWYVTGEDSEEKLKKLIEPQNETDPAPSA